MRHIRDIATFEEAPQGNLMPAVSPGRGPQENDINQSNWHDDTKLTEMGLLKAQLSLPVSETDNANGERKYSLLLLLLLFLFFLLQQTVPLQRTGSKRERKNRDAAAASC